MTCHNFLSLFNHYPQIIGVMGKEFNSHQFILELARRNQKLYIQALNAYKEEPAPFRRVHAILSRHLHAYPHLISYIRDVSSKNIFAHKNMCASWRRV
jgi:hypothetical protein